MNSKPRSIEPVEDTPRELLTQARTNLHQSVAAVRDAVDDAKQEVATQTQQAAVRLRQNARKAGEAVGTAFRDTKEALRDSYDTGRRQLRDLKESGADYARSHPGRVAFSALAVGLVAGAVCGSLAARKSASLRAARA